MGAKPSAGNFEDPLAIAPPAVPPRTSFFPGHRAELAKPLGSARCPGGTQSACEGTCTYLNFCTSLPALTFLHFPFCTYSCTSLPALPFLHLLSCTLSWSGVPPGVKFPPENAPFFRHFPPEVVVVGGALSEIFLLRGDLSWSGVPQGIKFPSS